MAPQRIIIKEIHPKDSWYFHRKEFEGKIFFGNVSEPDKEILQMHNVPQGFVEFFGVIEPTPEDPFVNQMSHIFQFVKVEPVTK